MRWLSGAHPFGRALRFAFVACAVGAAVILDVPLCPFALLTHHPCPGCGLTRATLALLRGHLAEALDFHPLVLIVAPLIVGMAMAMAYGYVVRGTVAIPLRPGSRWMTGGAIALTVAMLGVWLARFCGAFGGPVPV
jgi:hypothetical protein